MTRLDRNVDRLIAEENRRFLADPRAVADAQAEGDHYRHQDEGTLDPDCSRCMAQYERQEERRYQV